ncbi:hypothetical protein GCM10023201_03490 [Actinomycetospora corticicola]|uniref:DUF302 domain-containing protein n=1 Tax=Actinomycetospora corticicola TaxID=663602 RepID=A0A7Y9J9Y2_9PSEU|nr:DUF302 domain-containing protein [Actinomycetospora corticicola]NYD39819.1 hypothetical protein [Actinomycetospora corticicola]
MTVRTRVTSHEVQRLEFPVDQTYDEFRDRYERAVPAFDASRWGDVDPRDLDWATVQANADAAAPRGFLLYLRNEVDLVMRLAGHPERCTSYLMGNHTIAERMYRHDHAVMLYAPLRTQIHEDPDGQVWFTIDRPSTRFASFDDPRIAEVGVELDHKVADLLTALDVDSTAILRA